MLTQSNSHLIPAEKYKKRLLERRKIVGECWYWTGPRTKAGYGQIRVNEINSKIYVHRLSLLLFKPSEFDHSLQTNHKCNNPYCFNPEHLKSGTPQDNAHDRCPNPTLASILRRKRYASLHV